MWSFLFNIILICQIAHESLKTRDWVSKFCSSKVIEETLKTFELNQKSAFLNLIIL